ncbi:hypothetical protein BLTE_24780 [Blastochloris tepida]|uniref:Uncharacterized protein n=1 Tax=Blastochloris tepida TaxID=2233851 RepID=A0A348G2L0_9HYPH|nr:hypothetical protein BLTE_24780 [Blastochloris tepida]
MSRAPRRPYEFGCKVSIALTAPASRPVAAGNENGGAAAPPSRAPAGGRQATASIAAPIARARSASITRTPTGT